MARRSITLWEGATFVLVACAVVLTINTVYIRVSRPALPPTEHWDVVQKWQGYAEGGLTLGAGRGATTLVIFSDYQCPACKELDSRLRTLRPKLVNQVRFVFRNFPLAVHKHARDAAIAAECAAAQGRFSEYHEMLFADQNAVDMNAWASVAVRAGVPDTAVFSRCLGNPEFSAKVDSDIAAGQRLGVFGTPTILVDDEEFVGVPWDLKTIIKRHVSSEHSIQ